MNDLTLIDLLATRLEQGLVVAGWTTYIVQQKPQVTQEGVPENPTVYFQKLFDRNYGWTAASDTYNTGTELFDHKEDQLVETTFQISAMVPQDPSDTSIPTASDVINFLKMYVQSRPTIALWQAQNVGVLRITDIRNPTFEDDKNLFEFNPQFDIVLQHNQSLLLTTPPVDHIVGTPSPIPGDPTTGVFRVRDEIGV